MLTLVLIALCIFMSYIITSIGIFGVPSSISDTYYLFESKKKNLGVIFTIMMFSLVFLFIAPFLDITPDNWQFLAFLSVIGIGFVGAAPLFKKKGIDSIVHSYGAISSAIFSFMWIFICYPSTWHSVIQALIIVTAGVLISPTPFKNSKLFWGEMVVFLTMFISLLKLLW